MAHTKAGGSTRQKGNRSGKRLGVKKFGGQKVVSGNILIRQKGSKTLSGPGTGIGRDFTIFATMTGVVKFFTKKSRQIISVVSK